MTLLCLCLLGSGGCYFVRPGDVDAVMPISAHDRVGNVYLIRGWLGVFSFGMDDFAEKTNAAGVRAKVYQNIQWGELRDKIKSEYADAARPEPLILVGHSYGADSVVRIAQALEKDNITVDLLVTFDPVIAARVPTNVKLTTNYYKPNGVFDLMPWLRGVPLKSDGKGVGELRNIDLKKHPELIKNGTNHVNIDKNEHVHAAILKDLKEICPPRQWWVNAAAAEAPAGSAAPTVRDSGGNHAAQGTAPPEPSPQPSP